MTTPLRVGLISDTHGLLRPQAIDFLRGSDLIVHGGDICDGAILTALAAIAPVIAVRGNNDRGGWADRLRESELFKVGDAFIYLIHDVAAIDIEPRAAGVQVIVSGHSHQPSIRRDDDGVLYVNPGSAGPRRFRLPISVGELTISGASIAARTVELETWATPPLMDEHRP
jgi:putative phosphoesterase